ncbi:MAG: hypothetical protein V4543_13595 [Bacteroidota bacterium]
MKIIIVAAIWIVITVFRYLIKKAGEAKEMREAAEAKATATRATPGKPQSFDELRREFDKLNRGELSSFNMKPEGPVYNQVDVVETAYGSFKEKAPEFITRPNSYDTQEADNIGIEDRSRQNALLDYVNRKNQMQNREPDKASPFGKSVFKEYALNEVKENPYRKMLNSNESIKNAFIMSEIFKRRF